MGVDALDIGIKLKILKKQGKPSTQRWLLGELRKDGFPDLSESTLSSILSGNYVVGCANEVLTKAAKIIDAADKTWAITILPPERKIHHADGKPKYL